MSEFDRYICCVCDYIYDPEFGDPNAGDEALPGTTFDELPDHWQCPHCGNFKDAFENMDS